MSIRVAIVEDDQAVRENLGILIDAAPGFSCVSKCTSAEEALSKLPYDEPDVVILDIHLPGQSGIECIPQLRSSLPEVQVIMLTIEDDSEKVFESLKAGATGYLIKHVSGQEILDAIREVHNGGAPMSSHIARKVVTTFRQPPPEGMEGICLGPREHDVLRLLVKGLRTKEISEELGITANTTNSHIRHIYEKLHIRSRAEVIARFSSAAR